MKAETKEKLELVHLAGYLPDVEILILNYKCDYVGIQRAKVNGYYLINEDIYLTYVGGSTGKKLGTDCKLILRQLDLNKPITHNGETFVPILELAKINLTKNNIAKHSWKIGEGIFSAISPSYEVVFQFHDLGFYYKYKGSLRPVLNQAELFDKLNEWLIDWKHNLIEKGLAIDLNTIENGK